MPLDPGNILSRYRFVVTALGLQYVQSALIKPGKQLEPKKQDSSFTRAHQVKGKANMHTGYSTGENLKPVNTGKQPISALGTPVYSDLILNKQDEAVTNGIQILNVLMEVEQPRNIVETKVQGRDGEVFEYISDSSYVVTLRGAFVRSFDSVYPKEEMKIFLDLLKQKKSLKVTSQFLLQFGIYELVVMNYKMNQQQGKQNAQTFEISCKSDTPLLLKKKNVHS